MRNFGGFGAAMLEVVTFAGLPVECAGEALRLSVEDLKLACFVGSGTFRRLVDLARLVGSFAAVGTGGGGTDGKFGGGFAP